MKNLPLISALVLVQLSGGAAAMAQSANSGADVLSSAAGMRCSALAELDEATQTAAFYYVAGYTDGERNAMTIGTVGASAEDEGQPAGAEAAGGQQAAGQAGGGQQAASGGQQAAAAGQAGGGQQAQAGGDQPGPPGSGPAGAVPTLQIQELVAACAQSPDSRVSDIITAHGGVEAR